MFEETVALPDVNRRRFIAGVGAAVATGSLMSVGLSSPARAASHTDFLGGPTPKAILAGVDGGGPAPFDFIHWLLPGPIGSSTPFNGIPGFGLDVDPSTITDFRGFNALAVIAGQGVGNDGVTYDVEFDVRVMHGEFIAEDGNMYDGTFGFF